ncbi:MAG: mechanosensitive ion channel family protein [Desulfurococcaceae archaeon]
MNTAELVNLLGLDWVARIVAAILAIIIAYYIGKVAGDYAKKALVKAPPEVIYNVSRATRLVFLIVGVLIALSILRIDLTGFLLAAGFAGIVIGLAAQQTLGNFFAGLTLLLEGRLRVGDSIRVDNDWGVVESVGLISTRIRLWSGEILTLPNSVLLSSRLYNYTPAIARRADITIGISYRSDIGKAIDIIKRVLDENDLVLANPPPVVIVDSLGESSINLKVLYWAPSTRFWDVRRTIVKDLKEALEKEGIEIPYPQRVVWLKSEAQ